MTNETFIEYANNLESKLISNFFKNENINDFITREKRKIVYTNESNIGTILKILSDRQLDFLFEIKKVNDECDEIIVTDIIKKKVNG